MTENGLVSSFPLHPSFETPVNRQHFPWKRSFDRVSRATSHQPSHSHFPPNKPCICTKMVCQFQKSFFVLTIIRSSSSWVIPSDLEDSAIAILKVSALLSCVLLNTVASRYHSQYLFHLGFNFFIISPQYNWSFLFWSMTLYGKPLCMISSVQIFPLKRTYISHVSCGATNSVEPKALLNTWPMITWVLDAYALARSARGRLEGDNVGSKIWYFGGNSDLSRCSVFYSKGLVICSAWILLGCSALWDTWYSVVLGIC